MGQIKIRLSDADEDEVKQILSDFDLDLTTVTRIFYQQIIREKRIPLDFDLNSSLPIDTRKALRESMKMKNATGYDSGASLVRSLRSNK